MEIAAGDFVAFCGIQTFYKKLGFIEIQYLSDEKASVIKTCKRMNRLLETPGLAKNRDFETHIHAVKPVFSGHPWNPRDDSLNTGCPFKPGFNMLCNNS